MSMNETVKQDILAILAEARRRIEHQEFVSLKELSNHTIHNASIFQDKDSIRAAIIVYALYKIFEKHALPPSKVAILLQDVERALERNRYGDYDHSIKMLLKTIAHADKAMQSYIDHVVVQAEIKKGSKLYDHGISLSQAAQLMNVSVWDLTSYISKTAVHDDAPDGISVRARLSFARDLFYGRSKKRMLVFDTGPVITFAITGLLSKLTQIQQCFEGKFILTESVEHELIDRPLQSKKFRLEAFQVLKEIQTGTFSVIEDVKVRKDASGLLDIANRIFSAKGNNLRIVSHAEMSALAAAKMFEAPAVVIDERTTRLLIESPQRLRAILANKLHTHITVNEEAMREFSKRVAGLYVLRSSEIAMIGVEQGLFDDYFVSQDRLALQGIDHHSFENPKREIVESILWAIKLNGCSLSTQELRQLVRKA